MEISFVISGTIKLPPYFKCKSGATFFLDEQIKQEIGLLWVNIISDMAEFNPVLVMKLWADAVKCCCPS